MHGDVVADDGMVIPTVREWSRGKYNLLGYYVHEFAVGMQNAWQSRVYIDLFAGPGLGREKDGGPIVKGSPLIAVNSKVPFTRYIFCEVDSEKMDALKKRIDKQKPHDDVHFISENVNDRIGEVLKKIPPWSKEHKVLSLCFIDPYKRAQFSFDTITKMSHLLIDFIVLVPSFMDIHRNQGAYLDDESTGISEYLGDDDWRSAWERRNNKSATFGYFVMEQFGERMRKCGFLFDPAVQAKLITNTEHRNQPLYHLCYFTKNSRGVDFWKKADRGTDRQLSLF